MQLQLLACGALALLQEGDVCCLVQNQIPGLWTDPMGLPDPNDGS